MVGATELKKVANALIVGAETSESLPQIVAGATERARTEGGLWVGGTIFVSKVDGIRFDANAMNKKLHKDLDEVHIPTSGIDALSREFAFVSGIVVVHHAGGEFRFRCFGAKTFARRAAELLGVTFQQSG